ncbi:MAG: hypothetical protein WCK70_01915 [Chloroflexales bacterium]
MAFPPDPIVRVIDGSKRGLFDKPPVSAAGCQMVVVPRGAIPYVVPSGTTMRGADFRAAQMIYEVALSDDQFEVTGVVPSIDDAFTFEVTATINYHISDPVKVVQRNVRDTRADVRAMVLSAIGFETRDQDPHDIQTATRAVRRKVEGDVGGAAARLATNGYALSEISVTLRRDKKFLEIDHQAKVEQTEEEKLTKARRERRASEVADLEKYLGGDMVKKLSFLASQGPAQLENAIRALSEHEQQIALAEIKILETMLPQMEDHQQKQIINQVRQRLERDLSGSRAFQGGAAQGALPDASGADAGGSAKKSTPKNKPANDDDDWDS